MSMWTDELTRERVVIAKRLYLKLNSVSWKGLSRSDRKIMLLLGWFCLEEDDSGEPLQHIEHDFSEDSVGLEEEDEE